MQKILYATDFSENSEKALTYALGLARKNKAELMMVHVLSFTSKWSTSVIGDYVEQERKAKNNAEKKLERLFEKYYSSANGEPQAKFQVVENNSVTEGIFNVVEKYQPDLLIIGTRGMNSSGRNMIAGKNTIVLTGQSICPVLAIPEKATLKSIDKIVYASDIYDADVKAINRLLNFFQSYKPKIQIVHVSLPAAKDDDYKMEWFKELVADQVAYESIEFELIKSANVCERINTYIQEKNIDLLVMLEKERTGIIDKIFHNDHVKIMEFHAEVPIMVFNENYLRSLESSNKFTKEKDDE